MGRRKKKGVRSGKKLKERYWRRGRRRGSIVFFIFGRIFRAHDSVFQRLRGRKLIWQAFVGGKLRIPGVAEARTATTKAYVHPLIHTLLFLPRGFFTFTLSTSLTIFIFFLLHPAKWERLRFYLRLCVSISVSGCNVLRNSRTDFHLILRTDTICVKEFFYRPLLSFVVSI